MRPGKLTAVVAVLTLLFLAVPLLVVIPLSFTSGNTLAFPPPGYSLRWYAALAADPRWADALANSLFIAVVSGTLALVLGAMAAYGIERGRFPGRRLLEANVMAPLIVPPVINAIALYIAYAKLGLLGSRAGLVAAHCVIGTPYVVLLLGNAVSSFDIRIEQVAATLGASKARVLLTVLLPNLLPSVLAAWVLAFIVSFDEVILAFFLFGTSETLPKRMFVMLEQKVDPAIAAVATLLIGVSLAALAVSAAMLNRPGRRQAVGA